MGTESARGRREIGGGRKNQHRRHCGKPPPEPPKTKRLLTDRRRTIHREVGWRALNACARSESRVTVALVSTKGASKLLDGYNNNVRHRGKVFHIQTEDSGLKHPHVITHLFADGGRIISTKKTSYAEHIDAAGDLQTVVRKVMQEQHKAMFAELREGKHDSEIGADAAPAEAPSAERRKGDSPPAVEAVSTEKKSYVPFDTSPRRQLPAATLVERSLDEVILSYLADEIGDSA